MPSGHYVRTPEMLEKARQNLAKGHSKTARAKAQVSLRAVWDDEEKREEVSIKTRKKMRQPEIREKHLEGLKVARENHGVGFKGGNGQVPLRVIKKWASILEPQGFERELAIRTDGHNTGLNAPGAYKVDFGREKDKVAIEFDGVAHKSMKQKRKDHKKVIILESLGWTLFRVKHK